MKDYGRRGKSTDKVMIMMPQNSISRFDQDIFTASLCIPSPPPQGVLFARKVTAAWTILGDRYEGTQKEFAHPAPHHLRFLLLPPLPLPFTCLPRFFRQRSERGHGCAQNIRWPRVSYFKQKLPVLFCFESRLMQVHGWFCEREEARIWPMYACDP